MGARRIILLARDIALRYDDEDDLNVSAAGGDLQLGDSLENEIIISLFTWGQENADDERPDGAERGGYWGDGEPSSPNAAPEAIGSRLWLLDGTLTKQNIKSAVDMVKEALDWMSEDERISDWSVESKRSGLEELDILINVILTKGGSRQFSFYKLQRQAGDK